MELGHGCYFHGDPPRIMSRNDCLITIMQTGSAITRAETAKNCQSLINFLFVALIETQSTGSPLIKQKPA
jgi:hypothetical protein